MSSRGVTTVGCLAALTEHEVTNLPLRPPKVAHTRSVLEEFARRNNLESAQSEPADVGTDVTPTTGMSWTPTLQQNTMYKYPVTVVMFFYVVVFRDEHGGSCWNEEREWYGGGWQACTTRPQLFVVTRAVSHTEQSHGFHDEVDRHFDRKATVNTFLTNMWMYFHGDERRDVAPL